MVIDLAISPGCRDAPAHQYAPSRNPSLATGQPVRLARQRLYESQEARREVLGDEGRDR
jgi:hypothetical protein